MKCPATSGAMVDIIDCLFQVAKLKLIGQLGLAILHMASPQNCLLGNDSHCGIYQWPRVYRSTFQKQNLPPAMGAIGNKKNPRLYQPSFLDHKTPHYHSDGFLVSFICSQKNWGKLCIILATFQGWGHIFLAKDNIEGFCVFKTWWKNHPIPPHFFRETQIQLLQFLRISLHHPLARMARQHQTINKARMNSTHSLRQYLNRFLIITQE